MLPYNRALHTDDYQDPSLKPHAAVLSEFELRMSRCRAPYRKDHQHREWEYANVLRQLEELGVKPPAKLLDTGSGGSYLAPLLASLGYDIVVEDSMGYGDTTPWVISQCQELGVQLPIIREPLEAMPSIPDGAFDTTLCISTIEHVGAEQYQAALSELARVTKDGGYVFMTSDYFRDEAQADKSMFRECQHTRYTEEIALAVVKIEPRLQFVGDPTFEYRGDFVHNYSFINFCFQVKKG